MIGPKNDEIKIAVIGAGNVGLHLHRALSQKFVHVQIFSRREQIEFLGERLLPKPLASFKGEDFQLCFLCVPDDEIAAVSEDIAVPNCLFCHVSGTKALAEIRAPQRAVAYFFQSISAADEKLDFSKIDCFLEYESDKHGKLLKQIVRSLGNPTHELKSEAREKLHLCGVLINNFGNQLLDIASVLLKKEGISMEVLQSLYLKTFEKALQLGPKNSQTGPAKRKDAGTIDKHLKILGQMDSHSEKLYRIFTERIQEAPSKT